MSSQEIRTLPGKASALFDKLAEDPSKPMGEAMREVGYAEMTSRDPGQIVKGVGFQALLAKYLPQDKILKRHAELVDTDNESVALGAVKLAHQVSGNLTADGASFTQLNVKFEGAPQSYETPDGEVLDIEIDVDDMLDE
jgi:hypothetical protein